MFGGIGIFRDGLMFALADGDAVFLKSDDQTRVRFAAAGCRPFLYEKEGRTVETSYWSIPEEALDDPEIMKIWADLALQAAVRAKQRKPAGRRRAGEL